MTSLARLLNQSPEFAAGILERAPALIDDTGLGPDGVTQSSLPPESTGEGTELDEVAALEAVSEAFARLFGGVWVPPRK